MSFTLYLRGIITYINEVGIKSLEGFPTLFLNDIVLTNNHVW